jgi:ketosteroid isomerase-like protein
MQHAKLVAGLFLTIVAAMSSWAPVKAEEDSAQIIDHIHSIFDAYLRQDTSAIRALHCPDWTGFQAGSRAIVMGIDEYMQNAVKGLRRLRMIEYEILEIDVQVYGATAIVYYVARWQSQISSTDQSAEFRARSVDIYRREETGWNQAGSNLSILPLPGWQSNPDCANCLDVKLVGE